MQWWHIVRCLVDESGIHLNKICSGWCWLLLLIIIINPYWYLFQLSGMYSKLSEGQALFGCGWNGGMIIKSVKACMYDTWQFVIVTVIWILWLKWYKFFLLYSRDVRRGIFFFLNFWLLHILFVMCALVGSRLSMKGPKLCVDWSILFSDNLDDWEVTVQYHGYRLIHAIFTLEYEKWLSYYYLPAVLGLC